MSGLLAARECIERRLKFVVVIISFAGGDSSSSSSSTHKRHISITTVFRRSSWRIVVFSHFLSESRKRKMSASTFFPIISCVDTISEHCLYSHFSYYPPNLLPWWFVDSHPIRTHCASVFSFFPVQDALPTHEFRIKCVWSIQDARCNRRSGFILCYFRNLFQFRVLLHIKWGTAKARVRKLNQGNVSTISRATEYQSAQFPFQNRNPARIDYAATKRTFRLMTVGSRDIRPFRSCERRSPTVSKNPSFDPCWRY